MLKSEDSYTHSMISALLPYLLWKYSKMFGDDVAAIAKWFEQAAHARAADTYWDPKEECVKNTSDTVLV